MASDSIFELAGHIFPLFSGVQVRDVYRVDRCLGTGFWVDRGGHFLTCRHVLERPKPGQLPAIGQPFSTSADRFIPILESTRYAEGGWAGIERVSRDPRYAEKLDDIVGL